MYSEPGGQWPPQQPTAYAAPGRERPHLGLFVLIAGFAVTAFGMFALPVQSPVKGSNGTFQDIYFGSIAPIAQAESTLPVFGSLGKVWWSWLALAIIGLLAVIIAAAAALPAARRTLGWAAALVAVTAAALYSVALQQTGNIMAVITQFRKVGTAFDVAGSGLWVGYAGLGIVLLGAIITGVLRTAPAAPGPVPYPGMMGGPVGPPPQQQPNWTPQQPQRPPTHPTA